MAGRGFPPAPTALKILRGNPGRRPLNDKEPKPEVGAPDRPEILDPEARKEWARLTPELVRLGMVTPIDRMALTVLCMAWSEYCESRQPGAGKKFRSAAFTQLVRILVEFGLTPASRSRIKVDAPPPKSDLERFLEKHGR